MDKENHSMVTEFVFMGITQDPQLQIIFFVIFLLVYPVNEVGNVGMIILMITATQLHTPMYFFLCNLSFVDLLYQLPRCPVYKMRCAPRVLAFGDPKRPLPEHDPYLALQTGLQSRHCCWIYPGLWNFSVSREHSKAALGENKNLHQKSQ